MKKQLERALSVFNGRVTRSFKINSFELVIPDGAELACASFGDNQYQSSPRISVTMKAKGKRS